MGKENKVPRLDIAARKYVGVPFLHQGRNPAIGIDCAGAVKLSAMDEGLSALAEHDRTDYARNPSRKELEARLTAAFGPPLTDTSQLQPGDVVSMEFYRGKTRHVGIVGEIAGRLTLIHAYGRPPKVIEHGLDAKWRNRITGIYRMESR